MRTLLFAGSAALAVMCAPSAALADHHTETQDNTSMQSGQMNNMDNMSMEMNAQQQAMYDSWPADRQTTYDAWPGEIQTYYFTLDDTQREAFWMLTNDQRQRVYALTPTQRTAAWNSIMTQMNAMNNDTAMPGNSASSNMSSTARTTTANNSSAMGSGNIRFVSNQRVQNTPNDQGPPTGDVPICSEGEEDNCINAWEAGRRGPNVTQPLGYWPGETDSDM
ncbi:hypothetical protein [Qipengyuania atrilutea]|uniref:Uncharacterized protein n=1 Tax=Qipengyuania atrilutea TaxID=2744473 RepID=A0A850H057_9SPHN|nr:hypothetical protein [Actirhodobacter atriluteus]NVD44027.1 hypothetical protein [Actirhodobacter atriluteus]